MEFMNMINDSEIYYFLYCVINELTQERLDDIGLKSMDEVVDRKWLRTWIKAGAPVNQGSPDYKKQVLFKMAFKDILQKKGRVIIDLEKFIGRL